MNSTPVKTLPDPVKRSFKRARLRMPRRSLWTFLASLGPALITTNAGNDAGGIATYSVAGANYGMDLLWIFPIVTLSLIVVQEACSRMGIVTGKGLAALIREEFGVRWTAVAIVTFFIASLGTTASEFAGIASAGELFGITRYVTVPVAVIFVLWLVLGGTYQLVEKVFLGMTVVFFGYVVTAFLTTPDWLPVFKAAAVPVVHFESGYLFLAITLIGTTITSYMQFFLQAAVVERGTPVSELPYARTDVIISAIFADLIAFFIVLTTAQTLHPNNIQITNATEAAKALAPMAGQYAEILFAVGLVGASLFGATVLPLATAFVVAEALGLPRGISRSFREAPAFMGTYVGMLVVGALIALIPGIPLVQLMIVSQFIDGIQLPVILIFITLIVGSPIVMGQYASGRTLRIIQWATALIIGAMSLALLVMTLFGFG